MNEMTDSEQGLGEKALSKVAEMGISSQLDEVEELNIDIRTNPLKVMQGEVDSVAIEGTGMVIKEDLRMEKLEVNTSAVSINPLSAVLGNLELTQPASAEARIVLTEQDLNRALNSDFLRSKIQNLHVEVQDEPVKVKILRSRLRLPGEGKMVIDADFSLPESDDLKQMKAIVVPHLQKGEQKITLEILSAEGQGLDAELVSALLEQVSALLDLNNFELPGMALELQQMDVQQGQIVICANTQIEQIPST
jgi:hypothetical protein